MSRERRETNRRHDPWPFGLQLYCELKCLGLMNLLSRDLDYAGLQELKREFTTGFSD